ncbi:tetratricopeptide repeat protein [Lentzea sp. NPDC054927]
MFGAISRGWHRLAWQVPMHLHGYLNIQQDHRHEAVEMFEAVLGFGTSREQVLLQLKLSSLYEDVGHLDDALRTFENALPLVHAVEEPYVAAAVLINAGQLYQKLGRPDVAENVTRQALAIAVESGERYLEVACLINLAADHNNLGRHAEALECAERAVEATACLDEEYMTNRAHGMRAATLALCGRYDEALPELQVALANARRFGDAAGEAGVLEEIGRALAGLGRREEAVAAWQRSIDLWRELGDDRAERAAGLLAALEQTPGDSGPPG